MWLVEKKTTCQTWLVGSLGWCSWEHLKTEKLWGEKQFQLSHLSNHPILRWVQHVSTRHYHRLKQAAIRKKHVQAASRNKYY
jgi:hypothetical protein